MHSDANLDSMIERSAVVIPTLNAAGHLEQLLPALARSAVRPRRVLVIDSASADDTVARVRAAGHEVVSISRAEFGHGRTRNQAARLCEDCDFLVYLTQDACPQGEDWLARLLEPFADEQVALVYGRQLARAQATEAERYAREFNYPEQPQRTVEADIARLGIKALFCSNSFAAYRTRALLAAGGFPEQLPLGEDMAVAARLLHLGYARVYQPTATAVHSHDYSVAEEFRRYFDIGTLVSMDPMLRQIPLATSGEGKRFLLGELAGARRRGDVAELLRIVLRTAGKLLGYRLGQRYRLVPLAWRRRMSMHAFFWSRT